MPLVPLGEQTVTFKVRTLGSGHNAIGQRPVTATSHVVEECSVQPRFTIEKNSDTQFARSVLAVYAPCVSKLGFDVSSVKEKDGCTYNGVDYEVSGEAMLWMDELGLDDHVKVYIRQAVG